MEKQQIKYAIYFDYQTLGQWNGKKEVEDNCSCQRDFGFRNPEECDCVVEESLSDFIIEELSGEIIYED